MSKRYQIAIKLIASHIVLIISLIFISIFTTNEAFLSISITQTALFILFFAGYWEFFGLKFKKYLFAMSELLLILIFVWRLYNNIHNTNLYLILILAILQVYLLFELVKIQIVINHRDIKSVDIGFPFKDGNYIITEGGNSRISRLMNYHYHSPTHKKNKTNNSMLYATDIVKILNGKSDFLPKSNEEYPIFNEKIYSPIDGVIVKIENSINDNDTFAENYPYNTGNTVIIKRDNFYLLLGHLKKDSIIVKEGDLIQTNDLIGAIGNSGWTERPHLHMQLIESDSKNYWFGKGICIRYKNKNLYKNRLIKI